MDIARDTPLNPFACQSATDMECRDGAADNAEHRVSDARRQTKDEPAQHHHDPARHQRDGCDNSQAYVSNGSRNGILPRPAFQPAQPVGKR